MKEEVRCYLKNNAQEYCFSPFFTIFGALTHHLRITFMRKTLLLTIALLLCAGLVRAAQRSQEAAMDVARTFFSQMPATRGAGGDIVLAATAGQLLPQAATRSMGAGEAFYVFNRGTSAYVIVSGDDRMADILGYSDSGAFVTEGLPDNLRGWLSAYADQHAAYAAGYTPARQPMLAAPRAALPETVEPLLGDIAWDQAEPYNNLSPTLPEFANNPNYDNGRTVTGCVATAMAMVMKYHEHPVQGTGSHEYEFDYPANASGTSYSSMKLSYDFGNATFDWDNMLPQYIEGQYNDVQAEAVAELMLACGVSVDMSYSLSAFGGSGAVTAYVAQALVDYFGYNPNTAHVNRDYFTTEEWMDMLKGELAASRPVLYHGQSTGGGHAFVFDGYDADNLVHVNWGWSGANNGYFEVASLAPSSPGIGGGTAADGGFNTSQGMIIGAQPEAMGTYISHFYYQYAILQASPMQFKKGDSFEVSLVDISGKDYGALINMTTTFRDGGQFGLVAEKDGQQVVLQSIGVQGDVPTYSGFVSIPFSPITLPADMADGSYALYLASKDPRETAWQRVRGIMGSETLYTLTVSGEDCTIGSFDWGIDLENDIEVTLESVHALYTSHTADFNLTLSNNGQADYYGQIGVGVLQEGATTGEIDFVSYFGLNPTLLPAGEMDKELAVSGTLEGVPAGEYYFCTVMTWGDYITTVGTPIVEEVKSASPINGTLKIENLRLANDNIEEGQKLTVMADLTVTGFGAIFDDNLMIVVYSDPKDVPSNPAAQLMAPVFAIRAENPNEFSYEFTPNLPQGTYILYLATPGTNGYVLTAESVNFTIGPSTGIEDETAGVTTLVIHGQPVDDVLGMSVPSEAKMASVYNLSGQRVLQERVSGTECEVSVASLPAGYYIVSVETTDGTQYRAKFVKR